MMILWIFLMVSTVVCLCLLCLRILRIKHELNRMSSLVNERASSESSHEVSMNTRVSVFIRERELNRLAVAINTLLDRLQAAESKSRETEASHKHLVANIAHDMRTPLTSVLGYLEVLQLDKQLSSEERNEFARIAYQKAKSMYEQLESFFQLAKLEANDLKLEAVSMNITRIFKEMLVGSYPSFQELGIEPVIEIPMQTIEIISDPVAIERIIGNLLSNALKYGASRGKIGASLEEWGDSVRLEIWDNGPGISEENLSQIFERMYTVEPSRSFGSRGSGLGLTIARHLAHQLGGELQAHSLPYEKTSFVLIIPLNKK